MSLVNKTSYALAVDDIQQSFNTYWAAEPIPTHVFFDNRSLSKLLGPDFSAVISTELGEGCVIHEINHQSGQQVALGTRKFEYKGNIRLRVFTDSAVGRYKVSSTLVEQALDFFQQGTVDGVWYHSTAPIEIGILGRWWVVDVITSFLYVIQRGDA